MCKALEEMRKDCINEGMAAARFILLQRMIKEGLDEEVIYKIIGCTKKEYAKAQKRIK